MLEAWPFVAAPVAFGATLQNLFEVVAEISVRGLRGRSQNLAAVLVVRHDDVD